MTIQYGFYNSVDSDRLYDAEDFGIFLDGIISDGVIATTGNKFKVTGSGGNVAIDTGRAWFDKTWTYNDDVIIMPLVAPSTTNNRYDRLVLRIDKRISGRKNSIEWITGTPAATPVIPGVTRSEDLNEYPIATVYRPRDATTVTFGQITIDVGTPDCPIASNSLITTETFTNLERKRQISRGNNLGSSFTTAQKAAINNGSFDGLYLGDYWLFAGVKWRIIDFNYWYGQRGSWGYRGEEGGEPSIMSGPTPRITQNHIVIMPDDTSPLYGPLFRFATIPAANMCGYAFSRNGFNRNKAIAQRAEPLFGAYNIMYRTEYWPTEVLTGGYSGSQSSIVRAAPATGAQIYGSIHSWDKSWTRMETIQFAYFKLDIRNVWKDSVTFRPFWLMGMYTRDKHMCYHDWDRASTHTNYGSVANADHFERPVFGVYGS